MSKRQLSYNALSSIAQVVLSSIILFLLYRFLSHQLGSEQIGIWSLVMASTSFVRLADLGLGGSVIKFVAGDLGRNNVALAVRTIFMAIVSMAVGMGTICAMGYPAIMRLLPSLIPAGKPLLLAQQMLPYSLLSLWLTTLGSIFLGVLDGCLRTDKRAVISVSAALLQLVAVFLFVPKHGLIGLATIQVLQAVFILGTATLLVSHHVQQPVKVWVGWDWQRFRDLLRYGGSLQIGIIGQLLYEPIVKALLAKFGGLALTGYYEMANRMINQFKAVIISAYQTLVPYIAGKSLNQNELASIYLRAYKFLVFLAIPYYALIGITLPFFIKLLSGEFNSVFLIVSLICLLSAAGNTMVGPAFFLYMAIGRLRWTVSTHIAIGICNVIFSGLGGYIWGGYGVLAGACLAYTLGSYLVVIAFHHEYAIKMSELFPIESIWLALISFIGMGVSLYTSLFDPPSIVNSKLLFINITVSAFIVLTAWTHPQKDIVVSMIPHK